MFIPTLCRERKGYVGLGTAGKSSFRSFSLKRSDPSRLKANNGRDGGTSTKNLVHMAQLMNSGKLTRYDYGEDSNWKIYN